MNREVTGEAAERLQKCFSHGTIKIENNRAVVDEEAARNDGCSRNVYRHEDLKDAVTLSKVA